MQTGRGVAVELEYLAKTYANGHRALRGVNLRVEPGEWLVLVGPSGCGKTTTLRIIAGLEDADGKVQIGDQVVNQIPPWRRNVAMVFQRPALAPTHSVRQNLAFGAPPGENGDLAALAQMLELTGELDRFPHQLSGGQQQRVALGRALARRVPLYLLDEPLGHLDAPLRDQLRVKLRQWHERHPATVISVTHDPREAWALGDRVAVMWGGRVLQVGKPAEVFRRPCNAFVATFFAQGPMNFFNAQLRTEGNLLQWTSSRWPSPIPCHGGEFEQKEAMLGLRAEQVRVGEPGGLTMQVTAVEHTPQGAWVTGEVAGGIQLTGWAQQTVIVGQKVDIVIDWTRVFVFDTTEMGQTLYAPVG